MAICHHCHLRKMISPTTLKITLWFSFASYLVIVTDFTSTIERVRIGMWKVDVYVADVSPTWDVARFWHHGCTSRVVRLRLTPLQLANAAPPTPAEVSVAQRNMFGHIARRYWEVRVVFLPDILIATNSAITGDQRQEQTPQTGTLFDRSLFP